MKTLFKFIRNMLSTGTNESSKRTLGTVGYICAIIFIAIWAHDLIGTLLYVSSALIAGGTIETIFTKKFENKR